MRYLLFVLLCSISLGTTAQEVYLLDISVVQDEIELYSHRNISQNKGYDNQPSFSLDGTRLLFASNRNGQNDVVSYNLFSKQKQWLTQTAGSEYSPIELGDSTMISAVKLDKDGFQRLWRFNLKTGDSAMVHPELKIGYYLWLDSVQLACFVLDTDTSNSLRLINLATGQSKILTNKPGRCMRMIPDQAAFSFVDKSDSLKWVIRRYELATGNVKDVFTTIKGAEDYCWTPAGNLLMASDSRIFFNNPKSPLTWVVGVNLLEFNIRGITRIEINDTGSMLAIVANGE